MVKHDARRKTHAHTSLQGQERFDLEWSCKSTQAQQETQGSLGSHQCSDVSTETRQGLTRRGKSCIHWLHVVAHITFPRMFRSHRIGVF